jgi:hypothetical protein
VMINADRAGKYFAMTARRDYHPYGWFNASWGNVMRKFGTIAAVCAVAAGLAMPAHAGGDRDLARAVARSGNISETQARKVLEGLVNYIASEV